LIHFELISTIFFYLSNSLQPFHWYLVNATHVGATEGASSGFTGESQ
jgi:hypothetical protein